MEKNLTSGAYITSETLYKTNESSEQWQSVSSDYIKVKNVSSGIYKTILTINKSEIDLPDRKIRKVRLFLTPFSVVEGGNVTASRKSDQCAMGKDCAFDITDMFLNTLGNPAIVIKADKDVDVTFYFQQPYGPKLSFEYFAGPAHLQE